jgi:hypothetical protein
MQSIHSSLKQGDSVVLNPDSNVICIDPIDRWTVYHRLQELSIPCWCASHQPLRVQVDNATVALQLWAVLQRIKASRRQSLDWLERCWEE